MDIFIRDESTLAVTQNLAEALRYLRHEETPRVLWIDAICINQEDPKERSKQVKRMGDIYLKSRRVVIWLGPEADDSTLVLGLLAELGSEVTVDTEINKIRPISGDRTESYWSDPRAAQPFEHDRLSSIIELLSRPWFERLWVLQEAYLGRANAIVMCGNQTIPWTSLNKAIFCMNSKEVPYSAPPNFDKTLTRVAKTFADRDDIPFADLINGTQYCKCLDPRDRIYAIQSILAGRERKMGLEPDYTKTVSEVYQEFLLRYIDNTRCLNLLADARISKENKWPSWVPNWSIPRTSVRLTWGYGGSESLAVTEFNGGELRVTGVSVTSIKRVVLFDSGSLRGGRVQSRIRELRRVFSDCGFTNQSVYDSAHIKAICETICNNRFLDSHLPGLLEFPPMRKAERMLRKMLQSPHHTFQYIGNGDDLNFLMAAAFTCDDRAFVMLENGHVGLAPTSAQVGDIMTVFLGCWSAMVLRPIQNDRYKVVGEGYCQGVMSGEALLGEFPGNFRLVKRYHGSLRDMTWAYSEGNSRTVYVEDPRLGSLPMGWRRKSHSAELKWAWYVNDETGEEFKNQEGDPRLNPQALKGRGVDLKIFRLV